MGKTQVNRAIQFNDACQHFKADFMQVWLSNDLDEQKEIFNSNPKVDRSGWSKEQLLQKDKELDEESARLDKKSKTLDAQGPLVMDLMKSIFESVHYILDRAVMQQELVIDDIHIKRHVDDLIKNLSNLKHHFGNKSALVTLKREEMQNVIKTFTDKISEIFEMKRVTQR